MPWTNGLRTLMVYPSGGVDGEADAWDESADRWSRAPRADALRCTLSLPTPICPCRLVSQGRCRRDDAAATGSEIVRYAFRREDALITPRRSRYRATSPRAHRSIEA